MKVKEFIERLKTYDPEYEMMITLPPGWYKKEDADNSDLWLQDGWSLDSIDYTVISDKDKFVAVCPIVAMEVKE